MKPKLVAFIVLTGLLSIFLWGISFYNGWFNDIFLFGYNVYTGWFGVDTPSISTDENTTTVEYGKFAYKLLTKIEIPENINSIEEKAFRGNKLTSVTIGSDVSLGKDAIGNGFESTYNGNGKYEGTYTRTNIRSSDWIIWHGNFSYANYNGAVIITGYNGTSGEVEIPIEINGNPVNRIAEGAFKEKKLTAVSIPATVTYIGKEGFMGNLLTQIAFGNELEMIGDHAFRNNQLTSVTIPRGVANIGYAAFYNNQLTSITIGSGVTNIREYAFGKNKLTRLVIPDNVKNIEVNAFDENEIIRVSIGANVSIGSIDSSNRGILGESTGFNTVYDNNNHRAGIYTRSSIRTTTWTRSLR